MASAPKRGTKASLVAGDAVGAVGTARAKAPTLPAMAVSTQVAIRARPGAENPDVGRPSAGTMGTVRLVVPPVPSPRAWRRRER